VTLTDEITGVLFLGKWISKECVLGCKLLYFFSFNVNKCERLCAASNVYEMFI